MTKCELANLSLRPERSCPDSKATAKMAEADEAARRGICSDCGGPDRRCDGTADFSPAEIGFVHTCPAAACGAPVATLGELVSCVSCFTGFVVDCLDAVASPGLRSYPDECR